MTGVLHAVAAASAGNIVLNPTPWSVSYAAAVGTGNNVSALISFADSGQVSGSGTGTPTVTQGSNWFSPASQTSGTLKYWVRATLTAGTTPDIGTLGAWTAIFTNNWGWNSYNTPISKTCTLKFEIADSAAGTNIVWTTTGNVIAITHA